MKISRLEIYTMKKLIPYIVYAVCMPICFGGLYDADDGYLTEGEYGVDIWVGNPIMNDLTQLVVMGGGADRIIAEGNSYLEVQYTSTPLSNSSGIYDIMLGDYAKLLYLDGVTEELTIGNNATAALKGGRIDYISGLQYAATKHIDLYCQSGWSWIYNGSNDIKGITGLWQNGDSFNITFIDKEDYHPVWMNVNVIEVVPEPATLALLSVGGLLIRRKK